MLLALATVATVAGFVAAIAVLVVFQLVAPYQPSDADTPRVIIEGVAAWLAWAVAALAALIAGWRRIRRRTRGFWFTRRSDRPPTE